MFYSIFENKIRKGYCDNEIFRIFVERTINKWDMATGEPKKYSRVKISEEEWILRKAESARKEKEREKQRYLANRDRILERIKLWAKNNQEKVKEYKKTHLDDHKVASARHYKKNIEKIKLHRSEFRENNPEYVIAQRNRSQNSHRKNKDKFNYQGRMRSKIHVSELSDVYVKSCLKYSGFSKKEIESNPELIEIKRLIIKTKRLCKTLQN